MLKTIAMGTGALMLAQVLPGCGGARAAGTAPAKLAYAGAYTANGKGVHLFTMDAASGAVTEVKIDKASGDLSFTGQYIPIGSPAILLFR